MDQWAARLLFERHEGMTDDEALRWVEVVYGLPFGAALKALNDILATDAVRSMVMAATDDIPPKWCDDLLRNREDLEFQARKLLGDPPAKEQDASSAVGDASPPLSTGSPGRPTPQYFIKAEFRRRNPCAPAQRPKRQEEADELLGWYEANKPPGWPEVKRRTMFNWLPKWHGNLLKQAAPEIISPKAI